MTERRDVAYASLKQEIMSGALLPGEQLFPAELADALDMSRTPVRDALNALQHDGLVEILPRRGYFVSRVTVRDVEEVFDLRLILETASAERATRRIAEGEIERLASLSRRFVSGDVDSYRAYLGENREFHLAVAAATGNRLLHEALARVFDRMQRFLVLRLELSQDADSMLAEHHLLLDAFRARDASRAAEAMRVAIEHARDATLESIFRHAKDWAV